MAYLKISSVAAGFAEKAGIRIEVLQAGAGAQGATSTHRGRFDLYRQDLDVYVGCAWTDGDLCAFLRGWLAAGGQVQGSDPREARS